MGYNNLYIVLLGGLTWHFQINSKNPLQRHLRNIGRAKVTKKDSRSRSGCRSCVMCSVLSTPNSSSASKIRCILTTPRLLTAMPKTRTVTTVCNSKREVWTDYEEAKAYFLELMMTAEGEEHDRAECVYIQLLHGLDECSDED